MTILRIVVTDHLSPKLKAAGFSRSGNVFRRYADNGDALVLRVQTSSGSLKHQARFYLNVALVPLPWLVWMRESDDPAALTKPLVTEGAVTARVRSPHSGNWSDDLWMCTLNQAPERGRIAALAAAEAVENFLPLLDREELLRRLETGATLPGFCPTIAMRALLYLDAGEFGEAQHEINDIALHQPESPFVAWAQKRIAEMRPLFEL